MADGGCKGGDCGCGGRCGGGGACGCQGTSARARRRPPAAREKSEVRSPLSANGCGGHGPGQGESAPERPRDRRVRARVQVRKFLGELRESERARQRPPPAGSVPLQVKGVPPIPGLGATRFSRADLGTRRDHELVEAEWAQLLTVPLGAEPEHRREPRGCGTRIAAAFHEALSGVPRVRHSTGDTGVDQAVLAQRLGEASEAIGAYRERARSLVLKLATIDPATLGVSSGFEAPSAEGTRAYQYRRWTRTGDPSGQPCPNERLTDWTATDFVACIEGTLTYDAAANLLRSMEDDATGEDWEDGLWALIGLGAVDEALEDNIAPREEEPLWYQWSKSRSGYTPSVSYDPRLKFMSRVLQTICDFGEGMPREWEGWTPRKAVIDAIESGAMDFRIYEPGDMPGGAELIEEFAELVESVEELGKRVDRLGEEVAELMGDAAVVLLLIAALPGAALGTLIQFFIELVDALVSGEEIDWEAVIKPLADLAEALGEALVELGSSILGSLSALGDLVVSLVEAIEELAEAIAELISFIARFAADLEEMVVEALIRPVNCSAPGDFTVTTLPDTFGGGGGASTAGSGGGTPAASFATRPTSVSLVSTLGAAWASCADLGPAQVVDLRDTITFTFDFDSTVSPGQSTANHGVVASFGPDVTLYPYGTRVWVCSTRLDRASIMFDWFVALATRHYCKAVAPTSEDFAQGDELARQLEAANFCLRMAMSVVVEFAAMVIHETAHNFGLWHCGGGPEGSMGCVQDVAGQVWARFVTARLGLPGIYHYFAVSNSGDPVDSDVYWHPDLGQIQSSRGFSTREICTRAVAQTGGAIARAFQTGGTSSAGATGAGSQFQPYFHQGVIECIQGGVVGGNVAPTVRTALQVTGAALAVAAGWELLSLDVATAAELAGLSMLSLWLADELTKTGHFGDLFFSIDRPLEMDGNVTFCCVLNRNADCGGTAESTPCWPSSPPDGYGGCCCVGGDDGGGGADRGPFSGDFDFPSPFDPGRMPDIPTDDVEKPDVNV